MQYLLDSLDKIAHNKYQAGIRLASFDSKHVFMIYYRRSLAAFLVIIAMAVAWLGPITPPAYADGLIEALVRFDRMADSTTTGGRVCVTPSAAQLAQTEASVQVTFPTGYSVNTTAANWTVTTTNLDAGQTAWPGIGTASAVSGQTVTFPSTNLASSSTLYCFNFSGTSTLTTPVTPANNLSGTITTRTSAPATIDSSGYATSVISDDQIVVTASVGATFTFALSGNTDNFGGNLDPAQVNSTTGRTVTITTNAAGGWYAWARGTNDSSGDAGKGALESVSASHTIPVTNANAIGSAVHTLTAGTEDYGLGVILTTDAASGGAVTVDAAYNSTGFTDRAGVLSTLAFRPIASADGTAAGDVLTLHERATISNGTPAANDYTDTITVVGAGRF